MNARKKNFVGDQQGAIMVMGLFMAVSLIGSLWFILGIGEAIVVRDKAIEAADHAAFSAATVHARGMNYISALNLIMFALTAIYVCICLVADILLGLADIGGWAAFEPPTCINYDPLLELVGVGEVAGAACELGCVVAEAGSIYSKALGGIFTGIGALEEVLQIGMPVAAEAAAVDVISQYSPYKGALVSASLIPVKNISRSDSSIGLPLTTIDNQYLCDRSFDLVKEGVSSIIPSPFSKFINMALDVVDGIVDSISSTPNILGIGCSDGTWKQKNVHIVNKAQGVAGPGNGTDSMQMWALVLNAQDQEVTRSEGRVSMSKNKGNTTETQTPKKQIYYSQAEYYFDCTKNWGDQECYDDQEKEASFNISWKARLRRVYAPSFGNQMIGYATSFLMSGGNVGNFIAGQVGNQPAAQKAADSINNFRNGAASGFITGTDIGNAADGAMNFLNGGDKPIH